MYQVQVFNEEFDRSWKKDRFVFGTDSLLLSRSVQMNIASGVSPLVIFQSVSMKKPTNIGASTVITC